MNTYFERYAYQTKLFNSTPEPDLKISVVIPCYDEPDVITSLESLKNCLPVSGVEVIIIVNEASSSNKKIRQQNKLTLLQLAKWKENNSLFFNLLIYHLSIPEKLSGVGFARKVGMDEAARRFERIGNTKGVICCFDADSSCSLNYLRAIEQTFYASNPRPYGASIYFEHIFPEDSHHRDGITQYELHLRYYVNALKYIHYPFSHQTVGSSMAVRSDIYQKIGGMNKRKAGEDFYFLHRLMPAGNFVDINDTVVYPSARVSARVPFGTGKAMEKWLRKQENADYLTYDIRSFINLGQLFTLLPELFSAKDNEVDLILNKVPDSISSFLQNNKIHQSIDRLNKQSRSGKDFEKNWYRYFDGFKVLKYLHFSRDNYYQSVPVVRAAKELARIKWPEGNNHGNNAHTLLQYFRYKDKIN